MALKIQTKTTHFFFGWFVFYLSIKYQYYTQNHLYNENVYLWLIQICCEVHYEWYSPQMLVGICAAAKWKIGKGSWTGSRSSVKMSKMWGSGTSLSRFELENTGLRNELEPFWAWKMRISGTSLIRFERKNANLRNGCEPAALPNALRSGWAGRGRRWTGWN